MAQEDIARILNDLAADIVMLEPGDLSGLGQLLNQVEMLEKRAVSDGFAFLQPAVDQFKDAVINVVYDEFKEPEKALETLSGLLSRIQEKLREGPGGQEEISAEPEPVSDEDQPSVEKNDSAEPEKPAVEDSEPASTGDEEEPGEDELFVGVDFAQDQDLYQGFIAESNEHLDTIEENILNLEQNPGDLEILNSIFRPFHTIKGVSGFMNLKQMNVIAHHLENLLDDARNHKFSLDGDATDLILDGVDFLKKMLEQLTMAITGAPLEKMPVEAFLRRIDNLHQVLLGSAPDEVEEGRLTVAGGPKLGEILVQEGVINQDDLDSALSSQQSQEQGPGDGAGKAPKKLGKILVEQKKTDVKTVARAIRKQKQQQEVVSAGAAAIKVDTEKLDNLVDMVGELVIVQAMIRQDSDVAAIATRKLAQNMAQLARITSSLQKVAMSLRMVPIKQTFGKMVRLVRDLAKKTGKDIELEMFGEETEIDKNMVDLIYDPMVHMIRNSADHGIESPDDRLASGKSRAGTITLKAYHGGGNVIIEIVDDGRGLDAEKIRKKALEKGLLQEHDQPSRQELFNLILAPGFSTADKITDVSGRGVGMDVVKKAIEKLRGVVEVDSNTGEGTTVSIKVPLTLAIIDGMVVVVGQERYIIPTLNVVESLRPLPEQYHTVQGQGELIKVRDNLLPLVRLHRMFDCEPRTTNPAEALVVVVEHENEQFCLLVDELVGKQEIVIKSLGERLKDLPGVAGGAIMGDGRVGLIIDVAGLRR